MIFHFSILHIRLRPTPASSPSPKSQTSIGPYIHSQTQTFSIHAHASSYPQTLHPSRIFTCIRLCTVAHDSDMHSTDLHEHTSAPNSLTISTSIHSSRSNHSHSINFLVSHFLFIFLVLYLTFDSATRTLHGQLISLPFYLFTVHIVMLDLLVVLPRCFPSSTSISLDLISTNGPPSHLPTSLSVLPFFA